MPLEVAAVSEKPHRKHADAPTDQGCLLRRCHAHRDIGFLIEQIFHRVRGGEFDFKRG